MTGRAPDRAALKRDLKAVFRRHGVNVAVGLTKRGVAIRSQDDRVDARNVDARSFSGTFDE